MPKDNLFLKKDLVVIRFQVLKFYNISRKHWVFNKFEHLVAVHVSVSWFFYLVSVVDSVYSVLYY